MADPATFVKGLVVFGKWLFGKSTGAWITRLLITAVLVTVLQKRPEPFETSIGRNVEDLGGTEPKRIIYGEVATGGHLVFRNTTGDNLQDLYKVIVVAGHEVEDITDIYFDDTLIPAAQINYGTDGLVNGGTFQNYAWFWKHLGSSTQTHDTILAAAFSEWTADHDGRDNAYVVFRGRLVDASVDLWNTGGGQFIRPLVKGKNDIYDPRLDSSPGADPTNVAYQAWSNNPILCTANYLTDTRLGAEIPVAKIDWQMVADEADYCDVLVPGATIGAYEKRFTCNGVLFTTDSFQTNVEKLLLSCNGTANRASGLWRIRATRFSHGANLCTNATFDSNITGWSLGDAARGTIAHDAGDATILLTNIGAGGGFCRATFPFTTVVGDVYSVRANIKDSSAEANAYRVGGGSNADGTSPIASTTGVVEDEALVAIFEADATTSYCILELNVATNALTGEFDDIEIYHVSSLTIEEKWFRGDANITTALPSEDRYNTLHTIIFDKDLAYEEAEAPIVTDASYVTRDNNETIPETLPLEFVDDQHEAQRVARRLLDLTDQDKVASLELNYWALQVDWGEIVRVDLDDAVYSGKYFRTVGWEFIDLDDDSAGINLIVNEDASTAHLDPAQTWYSTRTATGTIVAGTPSVPAPSGLAAAAEELGIDWSWTTPSPPEQWDVIELWTSPNSAWASASKVFEGRADSWFQNLASATVRYGWVRARRATTLSIRNPNSDTSSITATAGTVDFGDIDNVDVDWQTEVSGTGKPTDNADVTSDNTAADTALVNLVAAATITAAQVNFDGRNDRDATAVVVSTIASDGTAIDHVVNTDSTADISFEWAWSGTESDIDGFAIYIRGSKTDSAAYTMGTTPTEELSVIVNAAQVKVSAGNYAYGFHGVPINNYYTFGIQAFRIVDADVTGAPIIKTTVVQPSLGAENPYRPSANVEFAGDLIGTIQGSAAGALANLSSVDLATGEVTNKTGANVTYTVGGGTLDSLKPAEVDATKSASGLIPASVRGPEGSTNIEMQKNKLSGAANDGEIDMLAGDYILPDATKRTLSALKTIQTPYEGTVVPPDGVAFVVWGASDASTRFSSVTGFGTSEADGVFVAEYDRAADTWLVVSGFTSRTPTQAWTPLTTDFIFGIIFKEATSGGIEELTQVVARVNDPSADVTNDNTAADVDSITATFTATFTGFATPPTGTMTYVRTGGAVTILLTAGSINDTSNSTAMTMTGMPAAIRPTRVQKVTVNGLQSGATQILGTASIATSGTVTFKRLFVSGSLITETTWVNGINKGAAGSGEFTFSYNMD